MDKLLLSVGGAAGVIGLLLCLVAGVARLSGHYWIGSFQTATLLQGGIAAMLAGCLCLLALLTRRSSARIG